MVHDIDGDRLIKLWAYVVEFKLGNDDIIKVPFATIEHIHDREYGGTNQPTNLMLSCAHCNQKKARAKESQQKRRK